MTWCCTRRRATARPSCRATGAMSCWPTRTTGAWPAAVIRVARGEESGDDAGPGHRDELAPPVLPGPGVEPPDRRWEQDPVLPEVPMAPDQCCIYVGSCRIMTGMERKEERIAALITAADRLGRKFEVTDLLRYPRLLNLASDWLLDEPRPTEQGFTQEMWDQVNQGQWLTNGQAKGVLNVIVARARYQAARAAIPQTAYTNAAQFAWSLAEVRNGRYRVEFGDGSSLAVRLSDMDVENGTEWARRQPKGTRNVSLLTQGADGWTGSGWISPDGQPQGKAKSGSVNQALEILAKAGDTLQYGVAFARQGNCCFICGRNLDTAESIDAGYGPVCADKWGLPWGQKQTPAAVEEARQQAASEPEDDGDGPDQEGLGYTERDDEAYDEMVRQTVVTPNPRPSIYEEADRKNKAINDRMQAKRARGEKLTYEDIFPEDEENY